MQLKVQDFHASPTLVLLHGWGVNSGVFKHLVAQLSEYHAVRMVDLPGFGHNNHVDVQTLNFEQYCALVAARIPAGATVAGWSLGGLVAQQIASNMDTQVQKLITICSSPYFMADPDWPGIKPQILQSFQEQLQLDFMKTLDRFLAIQAMGSETARHDLKTIRQQVHTGGVANAGALKKGLNFLQQVDLRTTVANCTVNTLRIFGSQDSLVPKQSCAAIEALQPNVCCHLIDKASHAPFISHTHQFLSVFNDFVLNH